MLKRNLIAFAIIGMTLAFTSQAFAQGDKNDERPVDRKTKVKKPTKWSLGASNPTSRTSKQKKPSNKPFFRPNPTGDGTTEQIMQPNMQIKSPRDSHTGQSSGKTKKPKPGNQTNAFSLYSANPGQGLLGVKAKKPSTLQGGYREGYNGYKTKQPRKRSPTRRPNKP